MITISHKTKFILAALVLTSFFLPSVTKAASPRVETTTTIQTSEVSQDDVDEPILEIPEVLPAPRLPIKVHATTLTFYNPEARQTDSSPRVTASGMDVFDGLVATNIYPFGTKLRFPDLFGDKVFEVQDRMNPRYANRMDIFLESKQEAKRLGIKRNIKVEVLEIGDGQKAWTKRAKTQQVSKSKTETVAVKTSVPRARVSDEPITI